MNGGPFLGVVIALFLIIGTIFGITTSVAITNHLGLTGLNWWVVAITLFGALGGAGSSLISIGKRD